MSQGLKLIERPDWLLNRCNMTFENLDQWFDENLKDHYAVHKDDLVRVYSSNECVFYTEAQESNDYIKAYLIASSIEPIKQETCADVLREIVEDFEVNSGQSVFDMSSAIYLKAKAALDRGE